MVGFSFEHPGKSEEREKDEVEQSYLDRRSKAADLFGEAMKKMIDELNMTPGDCLAIIEAISATL